MNKAVVFLVASLVFSQVALAEYEACPSFDDGSWFVGELRDFDNIRGVPSKLDRNYTNKTPRTCCDACVMVEGCSFWTIVYENRDSYLGTCFLYRSFACDKAYDGSLPFNFNKLARTGGNVCDAPQHSDSANVTLEDKRDAAVVEMRALLNAEIAVREDEAQRSEDEAKAANLRKIAAEEKAGHFRNQAMNLTSLIDQTKKHLATLESELDNVETNFTEVATEAANEAALVTKWRSEHKRLLKELANARKAKEVADLMLAAETAIQNQEAAAERDATPYVHCPIDLGQGEWVVGLLRNLTDVTGKGTLLTDSLNNVIPQECCARCSKIDNCAFWTWEVQDKDDTKGDCAFFTQSACDADADGNYPFQQNTKLGRVGPVCPVSSQ